MIEDNVIEDNVIEDNVIENDEMKKWSIRQAEALDAAALRELAQRTFHDTFAASCDRDDMATYMQDAFSLERVRSEIAAPNNIFLLLNLTQTDAKTGAKTSSLIGYAKLQTGETESDVSGVNPIELGRLYVDKSAIGQGYGSVLMQAALDWAADLHCDTLWLGVWEYNHRAIAFYKRWGFEQVGAHAFMLGQDRQTDWIMQRPV